MNETKIRNRQIEDKLERLKAMNAAGQIRSFVVIARDSDGIKHELVGYHNAVSGFDLASEMRKSAAIIDDASRNEREKVIKQQRRERRFREEIAKCGL